METTASIDALLLEHVRLCQCYARSLKLRPHPCLSLPTHLQSGRSLEDVSIVPLADIAASKRVSGRSGSSKAVPIS